MNPGFGHQPDKENHLLDDFFLGGFPIFATEHQQDSFCWSSFCLFGGFKGTTKDRQAILGSNEQNK